MNLQGRVAVITGGARGIGKACAERLLAEGAKVVIADIDGAELRRTFDELTIGSSELRTAHTDISTRAGVESTVEAAVKSFGRLDIMINNAGVVRSQDFLSITEADFDAVLNINLKGAFFGVQTAAKQMILQGTGGVIINMSSINARLANPAIATYVISKGGLNQLTAVAAVALASNNIRVVGIGPGTVLTDMVANSIITSNESRHTVLGRTPLGRCGEPREIASVAAFLASDDASYITGQTIYPDGGRLVLNYTVPVMES